MKWQTVRLGRAVGGLTLLSLMAACATLAPPTQPVTVASYVRIFTHQPISPHSQCTDFNSRGCVFGQASVTIRFRPCEQVWIAGSSDGFTRWAVDDYLVVNGQSFLGFGAVYTEHSGSIPSGALVAPLEITGLLKPDQDNTVLFERLEVETKYASTDVYVVIRGTQCREGLPDLVADNVTAGYAYGAPQGRMWIDYRCEGKNVGAYVGRPYWLAIRRNGKVIATLEVTGGSVGFTRFEAEVGPPGGPQEVACTIDEGNDIAESDESNNTKVLTLDLPHLPDLQVENVWEESRAEGEVQLGCLVSNQGDAPALNATLTQAIPTFAKTLETHKLALAPGERVTVRASYRLPVAHQTAIDYVCIAAVEKDQHEWISTNNTGQMILK